MTSLPIVHFARNRSWALLITALCVVLVIPTGTALAREAPFTPRAAVERLFTAESIQRDWFAPTFLAQVSPEQITAIIAQLTAGLGTYQSVEPAGDEHLVHFSDGVLPTQIALNNEGIITGLFFKAPRAKAENLANATAPFSSLLGNVSLLVEKGSVELAAIEPDAPLAVGSAFKLAVLAALKAQIETGARSWNDVVELLADAKSLPSGVLQTWPEGSPLTLHTLAAQMISISDNTATDALIYLLGRERIEAFAPRNAPFLSTREAFILKNPENAETLEAYRNANADERRAMLNDVAELPMPDAALFTADPIATDVEWFFSARELCGLMHNVHELPLMSINPGIASASDWNRVAYKGGSEPGVLALVTALTERDGDYTCIAAVWNDENPLDETRLISLYGGLIDAIKRQENE